MTAADGALLEPAAIELDAVSGRERIVAVLCDTPFTLADIEPRLRGGGEIRSGCTQSEVTLRKEPR